MRGHLLIPLLLLSACKEDTSPTAQEAARDARDIAMVEAAQAMAPAPRPISPEPITAADMERNNLLGMTCAFMPQAGAGQTGAGQAIALFSPDQAWIRLERRLRRFAADKGSAILPPEIRSRYDGRAFSLRIEKLAEEGHAEGPETRLWPGAIAIADSHGQTVYRVNGTVRCGF